MSDEFGGIEVDEFGGVAVAESDGFGGVPVDAELTPQQERRAALQSQLESERRAGDRWEMLGNALSFAEQQAGRIASNPIGSMIGPIVDAPLDAVFNRSPEEGQRLEKAFAAPTINLPRAGQAETVPGQVAAGVYNAGAELLAAFSSPGALAILPAAVNRAVLTAWVSGMAAHAPERLAKAHELYKAGDTQGAVQEVAGTAAELGLAELGRRHVMGRDTISAKDIEGQPRLVIDQSGGVVDPVSPDLVARNLAAPGTVRPTEQRAMASPIEGRERPAEVIFERMPVFNTAGEVVEVQRVPRIREMQFEEPSIIVPEPKLLKPGVEGGKLPERRQGFQRTAEDFIQEAGDRRQETGVPSPISELPTANAERPAQTREAPQSPETKVTGSNVRKGTEMPAEVGEAAVGSPSPAPETVPEKPAKETKGTKGREPGLISGTAAEAWADRVIATDPRTKTRSSLSPIDPEVFAAMVVKGAAHMERGARDFATWARKMIAEHGDTIRPHLRSVFEASQRGLAKTGQDAATFRQRKLAKRGSTSNQVDPEHRAALREDPAAFYDPQNVVNERQRVAQLTNQELAQSPIIGAPGEANPTGVLAKLELYKRLVAAGERDAAWGVFKEMMAAGTQMGQLINQFKQLSGATADGVLLALDRRLAEGGYDRLRPDDRLRVRVLSGEAIKAEGRVSALEEAWQKNPSAENFKALFEAKQAAQVRQERLAYVVRGLSPRSGWDVQVAKMQGGLMQVKSLVANVVGNVTGLGAEQYVRTQAAFTDMVDAALRGLPRTATVGPARGSRAALREMGRSWRDVLHILKEGGTPEELSKADVMDPIKPLAAWRDVLAGRVNGPRVNGKIPMGHKMVIAAEMTPGAMVASTFLRAMAAADLPTRRAARARAVVERIKLDELNGGPKWSPEKVRQATIMPELFFDRATLDRIEHTAAEATYQQKNPVTRYAQAGMNALPGPVKFLARGVLPFMNTPLNFAQRMFEYVPAFAAAKLARHIWKGERREAHLTAGRFVLGTVMATAGAYLYSKGLLAPPLDDTDEQQKARILSGTVLPPNHVNLSALDRVRNGGSASFQAGDRTADITRAMGFLGIIIASSAAIGRTAEKNPVPDSASSQLLADEMIHRPMQSMSYLVDQSILRGTAELLDALRKKDYDRWLTTYMEALVSSEVPNVLAAVSRVQRDFKPVLKDEGFIGTFENVLRNRIGFTGAAKDLPLKRDLRGRPIPETPEGAHPLLYQFFDITRGQEVPNDAAAEHIYRLWRTTGDTTVIPTPPGNSLSWRRKTYTLTPAQTSRLQELVGEARFAILDPLMENPAFLNAPVRAQAARLKKVYEYGLERGQHLFWREHGVDLEEKQRPAGFALP